MSADADTIAALRELNERYARDQRYLRDYCDAIDADTGRVDWNYLQLKGWFDAEEADALMRLNRSAEPPV